MQGKESISLAIKNIRASKMRSFLTMLGIIIGITAVIVIAGLGNGMKGFMKSSFSEMGTNTIEVSIFDDSNSSKSITDEEMYSFVTDNKDKIIAFSPRPGVAGKLKIGKEYIKTTQMVGVGEDYLKIRGMKLAQGHNIFYLDVKYKKQVCIIGAYLAQKYFSGNPLGQELFIDGTSFQVIGVIATKGTSPLAARGADDIVLVPYTAGVRIGEPRPIGEFIMMANPEQSPAVCRNLVEKKLREFYSADKFYVSSMAEMSKQMNSMIGMVQAVLTLIAAISLIVGGVGVMNIMLVSVTERTREIGIRKALGAKEKYIMQQFVIEATVTSGLGGTIGVLMGFALSAAATFIIRMLMQRSIIVMPSLEAVLLSFGISVFIGILFGYLPAKRAALLNPIDALQHN